MVAPLREGGRGRLGLRRDFVTDGQKRDYLNRASRMLRGATKNKNSYYRYLISCKASTININAKKQHQIIFNINKNTILNHKNILENG